MPGTGRIKWDQFGERFYETGVDRGVLYVKKSTGGHENGVAWNGLTTVSESPTGGEPDPQYADNIKYLNLLSDEEFEGTIEAFTYPDEFMECDGTKAIAPGVYAGQQERKGFGFSWRTKVGNDADGKDHAYKLHLVLDALAAPSEKSHETIGETPEAVEFSWDITTTPVEVDLDGFKPTAKLTFDSREVDEVQLKELEDILYGTKDTEPRMPTMDELVSLFNSEEDEEDEDD